MLMTDDPACWEPDVDLGGQFRLSGTLGKTVVTIAVRGTLAVDCDDRKFSKSVTNWRLRLLP